MSQKPWFFLALLAIANSAMAAAPDGGVIAKAPAAQAPAEAPVGPLKTADDKALYVLGYLSGHSWEQFNLSKAELAIIRLGTTDGLDGKKPLVGLPEYGPRIKTLAEARAPLAAAAQTKRDQPALDKAAKEKGAQVSPDGLVFISISEGTGAQPKATDMVKVQYRGSLANGMDFDSSYKRGTPAEFQLDKVVPCWTEAAQKMKVGGKYKFVCPPSLAYKDKGEPRAMIPGGAVLFFDVELLEVKPPPPPAAPGSLPSMQPGSPK